MSKNVVYNLHFYNGSVQYFRKWLTFDMSSFYSSALVDQAAAASLIRASVAV